MTSLINREQTISSYEIAQITGKRHTDVLKSIRTMQPAWEKVHKRKFAFMFKIIDLPNGASRKDPYYALNKLEFLYVITKYSDEARAKLVMRWAELEEKMILHIPQPKTINGVKCVAYNYWLLQNGYSLTSGQVRARIKKYPEQFCKTKDGWYMSEAIGQYFLDFRNPKERIAELPFVNPKQMRLFNEHELKEMIK